MAIPAPRAVESFWSGDADGLVERLASRPTGLTSGEASARSTGVRLHTPGRMATGKLALRQIENPIVLLLIGAAVLSMALGDAIDSSIILVITVASAVLGYVQERGALRAVEDLMAAVRAHATVLRDGVEAKVALDDVVLGDVLRLRAGDVIAADARVLESDALLLDESTLTGESFPVEKHPGELAASTGLSDRTNAVWSGTHVASGTGSAVIAAVGEDTEFGRVGTSITRAHVPTSFELGLRRFGFLIMRVTAILVAGIFVINVILHRPVLESFLFSLALAVGLTPQLLPTIVTVTLSHGARQMAHQQVIVKRLDTIEDIGAIDVLCTDKTGTLTAGSISFTGALDPDGAPSDDVRYLGWVNAASQRGFVNPIDAALAAATAPDDDPYRLIDELPYDFTRRMLSVLIERHGETMLIAKGAFESILGACITPPGERAALVARFEKLSSDGLRVLGVATRVFTNDAPSTLTSAHESSLAFRGFLCFTDPPKPDAAPAIAELAALGVATKLITGDNRFAAAHIAAAVGLDSSKLLVGAQMNALSDAELDAVVGETVVFAEIDPLHKEVIVVSLRRTGWTFGYLGDGINDAPSLRSADVGISVDTAVDIARHTASIVLLNNDLSVIAEGIRQGRRVFANTIKYVQVTISANFGNMFSMAAAAIVLPFLPLLPRQILLLNFLSDIPGMTIAADRVDPEMVAAPHGWDTRRLRNFMIAFGLISSAFDILTFAVLRIGFDAGHDLFRTGWFIESTATELAVMLVLRTRRRAWRSRPATVLIAASAAVAAITVALPFTGLAADLGLTRPSIGVLAALATITLTYIGATEFAKRWQSDDLTVPRSGP